MNSVTFKQAAKMGATTTTNGMPALESTGSALVDLFFKIGSARNMAPHQQVEMFQKAFAEDPQTALRILFWARDIRGGAGERQTFRNIIGWLHQADRMVVERNLENIPKFGRWDDVLVLQRDNEVKKLIADTLMQQKPGYALCAKWMPRQGYFAMDMAKFCGISHKNWRKLLVHSSNTVEQKMCAQEWDGINYSHLPSVAAKMYQRAFGRHDPTGYAAYKEALVKGEAKVNAGAIFPHDVVTGIHNGDETVGQAQWDALPNYMGDNKVLAMIDTSGSMGARVGNNPNLTCMNVALALGLYVAEKQSGAFKDTYLTFSAEPRLDTFVGDTVKQKLSSMDTSAWDMNTDIVAAFERILEVALRHKVAQADMPATLVILSDMQFDQCAKDPSASMMEFVERRYAEAGYQVPQVVFWNLHAQDNAPVSFTKSGVACISGFSPAIMKSVLAGQNLTPYDIMMNTVNSERYSSVVA